MNKKLFSYIEEEISRGTSQAEIIEALCANGWKREVAEDTYRKVSRGEKFTKSHDLDFGFKAVEQKRRPFWIIIFKVAIAFYLIPVSLILASGFVEIYILKNWPAGQTDSATIIQICICAFFAILLLFLDIKLFGKDHYKYFYAAFLLFTIAIEIQIFRLITISGHSLSAADANNWLAYLIPAISLLIIHKFDKNK